MTGIVQKVTQRPILVFGDIILDHYVHGHASRLSPEAPVPVINVEKEELRLGGAANVAANITSLDGCARLVGCTGTDEDYERTRSLLLQHHILENFLIRDPKKKTIRKTRIIANRQQVARLDYEAPISPVVDVALMQEWRELAQDCCAIVIADYNKGFMTRDVINIIVRLVDEYNLPFFIDPKIPNAHLYYGHVDGIIDCMTPNSGEAVGLEQAARITSTDFDNMGHQLRLKYGCNHMLITRGEDGMSLFGKNTVTHIQTTAQQVFDVSGAGDTVIATLALMHASGMPMLEAARMANRAAGIVVGKAGTATVHREELCGDWS